MEITREIRIIPSIASADQLHLADVIDTLGNWPTLHIDIEDGVFVPNITFGMNTVRQIASYAKQTLDAHLMTHMPIRYIPLLAECGVKSIAFHIESVDYPLKTIHTIHKLDMKAGLALNFKTPPEYVMPYMNELDYLLIMTSEPDGCDQIFRPAILSKLKIVASMLEPGQRLWADGGIIAKNIRQVIEAGADTVIIGRAAFTGGSLEARLHELLINSRTNTLS